MQSSARKPLIVFGASVAVFLIDWFYLAYITARGLDLKFQDFTFGNLTLSIPLQWLPIVGALLVSVVMWQEVTATIYPRRAGSTVDQLSNLRLARAIIFSIAAFVCVLYIPYLVGSDWFWARMSSASGISQIRDLALWLLSTEQPALGVGPLWQYSISQFFALLSMVSVAAMFARVPKRTRK